MRLFDNVKVNMETLNNLELKVSNSQIKLDESDFNKYTLIKNILNGKIITHSGQFHTDEIMCVALICIIRDKIKNVDLDIESNYFSSNIYKVSDDKIRDTVIRRPRGLDPNNEEDVNLYKTAVVLDIENGHFDHHHKNQSLAPRIENGDSENDRVASIGALWQYLGHIFDIEKPNNDVPNMNVYDRIWENFLLPISLQDVYGPIKFGSPVSQIISNCNGYTDYDYDFIGIRGEDQTFDINANFVEAVMLAYKILRAQIIKEQNFISTLYNIFTMDSIELIGGDVPRVELKPVPEGSKEPRINLECLRYVTIDKVNKALLLVNRNKSERDGSYRVICVDSEYAHLDKTLLENPAHGQVFVHPALFMATFETLENVDDFLSKLRFDEENHVLTYCVE